VGPDGASAEVYTRENNLVQPPANPISWPDLCASHNSNNGAGKITRITLRFLTPTLLKADGLQARRPFFGVLAKRLRDRINALSYFYCGTGLDIDFKDFGTQAEKIKTVADSTRWVESSRYAKRRQVSQDLSGFVGEATFEGDLGDFLPYLRLGEYLHVGKNAVFGNGWYEIAELK
jgi:CRISPR/Cas system endoribonuclease Cas6 (RAMP superfamily)